MSARRRQNVRAYVYWRDHAICWLCGKFTKWVDFTIDHLVPASAHRRPRLNRENLRCAHSWCNKRRGCKTEGYDLTPVPSPFMPRIQDMPGCSR